VRVSLLGGRAGDVRRLSSLGAACGYTFLISEHAFSEYIGSDGGPVAFVIHADALLDVTRDALRAIRAEPRFRGAVAILSLSAEHLAQGNPSQLGFDDFVVDPYSDVELRERVRLHRRQTATAVIQNQLEFPGLVVDLAGRSARTDGRSVALAAREFALLAYFAARPGRVLSREELLREVWGHAYEGGPRTVDIHVRRLRKKLGVALPLETLRGLGYKLGASPEGEANSSLPDDLSLAV
jgi:DNA-binding response OmpR family regulator